MTKITKARKKALIEALKMFSRIYLLAVIPILCISLEAGKVDFKSINIVGVIAVLKAVDEYLHKLGTNIKNESLAKGLTRY